MSLIANCIKSEDSRLNVVVEENGKKYHLENSSRHQIAIVKVDKCVKQNQGEKRCDFLLQVKKNVKNDFVLEKSIFIELKGGKIIDGVKQIHESILFLQNEIAMNNLECKIVGTSNVPKIKNHPYYLQLLRLIKTEERITIKTNSFLKEKI